jgi:hypothetical protein
MIDCMRGSSKQPPKDANELAGEVVKVSTEGLADKVRDYLASIGRKGGLKGGRARAEKLTAKRRSEIAQQAARKRWGKRPQPPFGFSSG